VTSGMILMRHDCTGNLFVFNSFLIDVPGERDELLAGTLHTYPSYCI